jgi:calcineurin-like phosphoesterase family protein
MSNVFLISDTHFGHKGVTQFLNNDGSKLRPWGNVEEMDEALVANWNKVVGPKDKVYHLGDVVINRKALQICGRLNGEKVLIRGNHDIFRLEEYTPYFKDVRGSHKLDNYILTHIPIHPKSLARWCGGNIHGHLHSSRVEYIDWHREYGDTYDPRYLCVSVEQINYTPISFEEARKKFKEQQ